MQLRKHIFATWLLLIVLLRLAPALAVEQLVNNCVTPLAANITTTTSPVTFTITGASCFPTSLPAGGTFSVLIDSEWMTVTAISGTSITATRPEGGSTAATHNASAPVWILETARGLGQLKIDAGAPQAFVFAPPGVPTAGQSWSFPCPYTITFPAGFNGTYPDGISRASCGTSPSETDTWTLSINGTQAGTAQLGTTCTSTSGTTGTGVTFATTGGVAQICSVGQQFTLSTPVATSATLIGSTSNTSNTTTIGLTTPGSTAIGDTLIACISYYTTSPSGPPTGLPTGFGYATGSSTTSCQTGGAGGGGACIFTNPLTAAPSGSYTWTFAANSYVAASLIDYRGLNNSSLVDTGVGDVNIGTPSSGVSVPYGPTTVPNDLLLTCLGSYQGLGWSTAPAAPVVQVSAVTGVIGGNAFNWVGSQSVATPGSGTVTGTLNSSTNTYGAINLPLKIGAAPVSGSNLGFTLLGHISALP